MRVVDIYDRYQDITDVAAFADATDAVYLKGSDGGGVAAVRADAFAKIMRDTGTPFGLYHYAQFNPAPEAQAQILVAEARRLGATGLPPALDLEAPFLPNQTAREFAIRFLNELRNQGLDAVTLYANTSMLTGIRAWTLGVPGLRIWAATYGNNDPDFDDDDRARLQRQYPHPVWLYQYSSTGRVPGIPQNTDLNVFMTTEGWENDMPGWDENLAFTNPETGVVTTYPAGDYQMWTNYYANMIPAMKAMTAEILTAVTEGNLDPDEVLARVDTAVREATEKAMTEKVMPALRAAATTILTPETSEDLVERFLRDMSDRLGQPVPQTG